MAKGIVKGGLNDSGGTPVVLTGDATEADVLIGKTFYKDNPNNKLTGTFEWLKSISVSEYDDMEYHQFTSVDEVTATVVLT